MLSLNGCPPRSPSDTYTCLRTLAQDQTARFHVSGLSPGVFFWRLGLVEQSDWIRPVFSSNALYVHKHLFLYLKSGVVE
jgi:hypothetical protein